MELLYRLCFELHKTPDEIRAMTSRDWVYLLAYARREGFLSQRLECTVAQSGAYIGGAWGGKAKPKDLLPQFHQAKPKPVSMKEARPYLKAYCEAMKRAASRKGANGKR